MQEYFSKVTPEQLEADLKKADFDFYNKIVDSPVVHDPNEKVYQYKDENRFWWKIVISSPHKRTYYDVSHEIRDGSTIEIIKYPVTIYRDEVKVFFDDFSSDDPYYIPTINEIMTRYCQYIVSVAVGFTIYGKLTKND